MKIISITEIFWGKKETQTFATQTFAFMLELCNATK